MSYFIQSGLRTENLKCQTSPPSVLPQPCWLRSVYPETPRTAPSDWVAKNRLRPPVFILRDPFKGFRFSSTVKGLVKSLCSLTNLVSSDSYLGFVSPNPRPTPFPHSIFSTSSILTPFSVIEEYTHTWVRALTRVVVKHSLFETLLFRR